jgi:hypothetical protein
MIVEIDEIQAPQGFRNDGVIDATCYDRRKALVELGCKLDFLLADVRGHRVG